ncbi:MAG: hypothetical protein M3Q36_03350, partial [bacterium]|nr:hypothetical protein [bacterium]
TQPTTPPTQPTTPPTQPTTPPTEGVCNDLDTGHLSANNDGTFTYTAPEGYVIVGYCVKAGSVNQGDGPEYCPGANGCVSLPATSITFSHSSGKGISHFSVDLEEVTPPTEPTVPEDTTPPTASPTGTTVVVSSQDALPVTGYNEMSMTFVMIASTLVALGIGSVIVPRLIAARRR